MSIAILIIIAIFLIAVLIIIDFIDYAFECRVFIINQPIDGRRSNTRLNGATKHSECS